MRKRYSPEFKARVTLELIREEKSVAELASEYGVHPVMLQRWKKQALDNFAKVFSREEQWEAVKAQYEKRIEELYTEVGRLSAQLSWLKKKGINLDEG